MGCFCGRRLERRTIGRKLPANLRSVNTDQTSLNTPSGDGDPALAHGVANDDEQVDLTVDADDDHEPLIEDEAEVAIGTEDDEEIDDSAEVTEVAAAPPTPPATQKSVDGAQRPPPPPPSVPARKPDGASLRSLPRNGHRRLRAARPADWPCIVSTHD